MLIEDNFRDNYEVIGVCDLEKMPPINNTQSWTPLTISKVIMVTDENPDIEAISKIYNNVEITSTSVINTPWADTQNAEGVSLTGKKLLIEGNVYQTVIYIADTPSKSIHLAHFKIPFCSYTIISSDSDYDLDQHCVIPCIEDVSAQVLSARMIFMNITLFLLARKYVQRC